MPSFQVVLRVLAEGEIGDEDLESAAEVVLDRLHADAAFVAMGPVMSVDFGDRAIELEFTVSAERPEQIHTQVGRVTELVLSAANAFEYQRSTTDRLEPTLA